MNNINKKNFCILPWIHTHIWADGKVYPCCMASFQHPITNYNKSKDLKEILNHDEYIMLRKRMLDNKRSKHCAKCYEIELSGGNSLRTDSNQMYKPYINENLKEDFSEEKSQPFKLVFLDIRFSNLCNLSCVTCSPIFSQKLYPIHKKLGEHLPKSEKLELQIFEDLKKYLLDVKNVNFAGGEPLISEDHYKILDYWIKNNHLNVHINYTTNMTTLNYKSYQILDYWKHFKNITVLASIDDVGEDIQKIRVGANWEIIQKNIKAIKTELPNVKLKISPTVSALNIHRIFEMIQFFYLNYAILPQDWQINILQYPEQFSAKNISVDQKRQFKQKLLEHKDWLSSAGLAMNLDLNMLHSYIDLAGTDLGDQRAQYLNKFYGALKE
jgi:radical SAM protein with 4Fe4S-binding SPASM domain